MVMNAVSTSTNVPYSHPHREPRLPFTGSQPPSTLPQTIETTFGTQMNINTDHAFTMHLPTNAPLWPSSSDPKRQPTPGEWEVLKPTIRSLWYENDMSFKEVARILLQQHNFEPTKKQFARRVEKWGFRKNYSRKLQASLPTQLDTGPTGISPLSIAENGYSATASEGRGSNSGSLTPNIPEHGRNMPSLMPNVKALSPAIHTPLPEESSGSISPSGGVTMETPVLEHEQSLDGNTSSSTTSGPMPTSDLRPKTLWDSAKIMDSPKLTTLINALKIDDEMPLLSLDETMTLDPEPSRKYLSMEELTGISKHPIGNREHKTSKTPKAEEEIRVTRTHRAHSSYNETTRFGRGGLVKVVSDMWPLAPPLSPWPVEFSGRTMSFVTAAERPKAPLNQRIKWCEKQLETLEKTLPSHNIGVLSKVQQLANLYYEKGRSDEAEDLYSRVLTTKQKMGGIAYQDLATVYFAIMNVKVQKSRILEALDIHVAIHPQIVRAFGPESDIALNSMSLMGMLNRCLERYDEAETYDRQKVQITLNKYGFKHPLTIKYMHILATTLFCKSRVSPVGKDLLRSGKELSGTALQIELSKVSRESIYEGRFICYAELLSGLGEHEESLRILREIVVRGWSATGYENADTLANLSYYALSLCSAGRYEQTVSLSHFYLPVQVEVMGMSYFELPFGIEKFAVALEHLGCWEEATARYEEAYLYYMKGNSPGTESAAFVKQALRKCYTTQGLYPEGQAFADRLDRVLGREVQTTLHLERRRKFCWFVGDEYWEDDQVESRMWKRRRLHME
ncbi:hypothetical protein B0O99DRAFT_64775 [Bisporella sp. PMI_857]|nr:hypothetical protein B0O99DRAFT_64775 [Bisporella sp. PMI_857]